MSKRKPRVLWVPTFKDGTLFIEGAALKRGSGNYILSGCAKFIEALPQPRKRKVKK